MRYRIEYINRDGQWQPFTPVYFTPTQVRVVVPEWRRGGFTVRLRVVREGRAERERRIRAGLNTIRREG
mgnify:FL=1